MVNKVEFESGMCSSCYVKPITKHGLMCDGCSSAYEGVNIKGDNEAVWLQKRP